MLQLLQGHPPPESIEEQDEKSWLSCVFLESKECWDVEKTCIVELNLNISNKYIQILPNRAMCERTNLLQTSFVIHIHSTQVHLHTF